MRRVYALLLLGFVLVSSGYATSASRQHLIQQPLATARDVPDTRSLATGASAPATLASPLLTTDVPATCPVTQPSDPPFDPPGRAVVPFEGRFWYGNDNLFLALPLDGTWSQLGRGEKVFWWSGKYPGGSEESQPAMTIRGRHLDQPGETFEQSGATNASHPSFPATAMLHGLSVPTRGCWEITGAYKGEVLSFVVWVP